MGEPLPVSTVTEYECISNGSIGQVVPREVEKTGYTYVDQEFSGFLNWVDIIGGGIGEVTFPEGYSYQ